MHSTAGKKMKPCIHFQRNRCMFGKNCKFSHDTHGHGMPSPAHRSANDGSAPARGHERTNLKGDHLREWKSIILTKASTSRCSQANIDRFFPLALQLMDGDVGASQEAIRLLAQDDGLAFVRDLAEVHIPNAHTTTSKASVWAKQLRPLFQLLTHPRVVDSAVLEQHVAGIYNFLQGIGGRRMKPVFTFVTALLDMWPALHSSWPPGEKHGDKLEVTELCLGVVAKMIDSNTTNLINPDFHPIVQSFEGLLLAADDSADSFAKAQGWKHLHYIQRRLDVGAAFPEAKARQKGPINRAEFILRRDLPGNLSAEGARHDNDHSSIQKISILPTQDEIWSPRSEYLPTNDVSQFHVPGIQGRLDREFRLLREDTVGQLRDAVRVELDALKNPTLKKALNRKNNVRTYTYRDAKVLGMSFEKHHGLDIIVQFRQNAPGESEKKRNDWWVQSKRLQPGGLICVISSTAPVLFCVVAESTVILNEQKPNWNKSQKHQQAQGSEKKPSLARHKDVAYVHLNLVETTKRDIAHASRWFRGGVRTQSPRFLVEFPGVLLPSFQHTLRALQRMSQTPNIPFVQLIAPEQHEAMATEVSPPQYSMKTGFSFDLSCLTKSNTRLKHSFRKPLDPAVLAEHTTLDATQSVALLDALSRSMALIQGPPGTGKSFTGEKLIKVLLANKGPAQLGPILCVCYTNHALDQLLEHLYKDGVTSMIRIGSRSKSEILENLNIRVVSKMASRTKSEKHSLWECECSIESSEKQIADSIRQLHNHQSQRAIEQYLEENHPGHFQEFFGVDQEGFQTVHSRPGQLIEQWRNGGAPGGSPREIPDLLHPSLWSLSRAERARLHTHWLNEIREPIITRIISEMKSYSETKERRDRARQDVDVRCLSGCDVIGVTTTGLARNLDLLRRLRGKVLLCEEAGEVLEAHSLTALLPSVEHAILIGDHQQLRPQTQNYDLQSTNIRGAQYSFDVSLFERLINPPYESDPKLPFNTLETQRRMHPQISELIRKTLYPSLEDGGAVSEYPQVQGIKKRLFWLHHEVPEDGAMQLDATTTSHTNTFEIEMTIALAQHLVKQGSYGPDDIAVITPYLGQLHRLRRSMEHIFEISVGEKDQEKLDDLEAQDVKGDIDQKVLARPSVKTTLLKSIRLATVDNFQGEEAKVIVISLVRSNDENRCGFLSTSNRINVLLSRAQHGMYLIGNSNTYGHVPMWVKVLSILEENDRVGPQLELQCPRHPRADLLVSHPDHFSKVSPEGGCTAQCDKRLQCGHSCIYRCHSEMIHNAVKCLEPCPRPKKGCDHPCRRVCGDQCEPKCTERLVGINLALSCGHRVANAFCWEAQNTSLMVCKKMVEKTVPGCGHKVTVSCPTDVTAKTFGCQAICGDPQECGHSCRSLCYQCKEREGRDIKKVDHGICVQPCGRKYTTCQHSCSKACHGEQRCPPCPTPCEVRCSHSRCSKKCHEPCTPCAEQTCASKCPHSQCSMPCAAPCNWVPCSKRCEKVLDCGHRCPSLCGELCPTTKFCQECGPENIKDLVVDFIMGMQYRDINLDEDPCIFPDCGHVVTATNMDGVMDMAAHYEISADGYPTSIAKSSQPFSMDEVKACPTCRGSLRNVARYGRIVRRAMLDESTKKFITWSHEEYHKLAGQLIDVQEKLSGLDGTEWNVHNARSTKLVMTSGRWKQLALVNDCVGGSRYKDALALWNKISQLMRRVHREEQPFQRVADFVQHAQRQGHTGQEFDFKEDLLQVKGEIQASALRLKCEIVIFADFMKIRERHPGILPGNKLNLSSHMADCETLAQRAMISGYPRQEFEGHVYFAHFCAAACALLRKEEVLIDLTPEEDLGSEEPSSTAEDLKRNASAHLEAARKLLDTNPSTKTLESELEAAEIMIRDGIFYQPVSHEEMRAVYKAMAGELRGSGHWYTCAKGHPFTVGECGMPMQRARCPECGSPVGGLNHTPDDGVTHATEIDEIAREFADFGL